MISRRLGPGFDVQFEPALGIKRGIKPRAEALFFAPPCWALCALLRPDRPPSSRWLALPCPSRSLVPG
ncbi:hypothetical protein XAC3810_260006 [Xanthomonas citri pv. citri]|uniref:Uncharacterized protein n=1 Tax=Xanthomonas citri pv. citri TaxID=611301 RepID=A0A0U5FDE7_XANCI|nr:hypothetical protein XAC9322_260009 [Xanthomonas citri pv. citri]CEE23302.1 hypothetical protein XAC1083_250009 [Xanthomonas citri pv. citri]CEE31637.1 hypothetical protein XAC3810_260006 [Xanthomonas citri pv. citri]CEE38007.1 hypothetical protein XAC908_390002 [Xanthomonas citri pv. citri]CEE60418.1 hypothetical protein XACW160_300053 [Xanthomonas citri pv. citri]